MTDEQKYTQLLKAIAELLAAKETDMKMKDYELFTLRNRLSDSEKENEELRKGKQDEQRS